MNLNFLFFFAGMYWIDPNQGSPVDAIEVHCDLKTHTTCILPKPSQVADMSIFRAI